MKNAAVLFTLLTIISCTTQTQPESIPPPPYPYEHITDEKVRTILKRAIDKAGGFAQWKAIKTIKYTKHNMLFLEDGSVEVNNVQRHEYVMKPQFSALIR